MTHSPLPWRVKRAPSWDNGEIETSIVDSRGNTVADDVCYYPTALDPQDAQLIVNRVNINPVWSAITWFVMGAFVGALLI